MQYKVYVKTNSENYIIDINSSAFIENTRDWIEIDQGNSINYYLAQRNYLSKPIRGYYGIYHYKLINNKPVECSMEDIAAQKAVIEAAHQLHQNPYVTWDELNKAYYEGVDSL